MYREPKAAKRLYFDGNAGRPIIHRVHQHL
jgi:hypothetical protein